MVFCTDSGRETRERNANLKRKFYTEHVAKRKRNAAKRAIRPKTLKRNAKRSQRVELAPSARASFSSDMGGGYRGPTGGVHETQRNANRNARAKRSPQRASETRNAAKRAIRGH